MATKRVSAHKKAGKPVRGYVQRGMSKKMAAEFAAGDRINKMASKGKLSKADRELLKMDKATKFTPSELSGLRSEEKYEGRD
jgi:hypothetical protein